MSEIDELLKRYERYVMLPWDRNLAGAQRVWFASYNPGQERRLRLRIVEFEVATIAAGHNWRLVDITDLFAVWMANHDYRDAYFEEPEFMELALADFSDMVAEKVRKAMTQTDEDTVVALLGLASLFGLARVAELIAKVDSEIRGRLLAFFPGQRDGANWRLLNARDGWNYHAVPI